MSNPDFPDFTSGVGTVSGSGDFPDWTSGVTIFPGPIIPSADFPDWTVASIQYTTPVVNPNVVTAPAGLGAWYQADAITGFADGAALTNWPDSSGNGRPLGPIAAPSDPTYYKTTAAKLINGLPAVWFAKASINALKTASNPNIVQPITTLCVLQSPSLSSNMIAVGLANVVALEESPVFYAIDAPTALTGGTTDTNVHTVCTVLNGANGLIRVDGTQVAAGNVGTNNPGSAPIWMGTLFNGIVDPWDGPICELILYWGSALTLTQIQAVEHYLKVKWGTP